MNNDLLDVDPSLLAQMDMAVPRYTSYPTAVQFSSIEEEEVLFRLKASLDEPLSIYIHIPFCKTMCLFCACSVVLNRDPEKQGSYHQSLLQEIRLVFSRFPKKPQVAQLHFGGGTPTNLTEEEFSSLFSLLHQYVDILPDAEVSIEVDPRTVSSDHGKKLKFLRTFFNRISFGVQDADPRVQEAVRRRQSWEMTEETFHLARELNFSGINLDLIYGLPLQTPASFSKTAEKILTLRPDRIAFFSYARVPWLKAHQKAIPEKDLPSRTEKFQIYVETRSAFMRNGYTAIGMDHFAKNEDSLAIGYREKRLTRNFQGYSLKLAENLLGLGMSAVGFMNGCYIQNVKEIKEYQNKIKEGHLPILRGRILTEEDARRKYVIHTLMCDFSLDKKQFFAKFGIDFDTHFANIERKRMVDLGLLEENGSSLSATPLGRLFIRNIASLFDQYLEPLTTTYSRSI